MNILRLSTLSLTLAIAVITLTIVLAPLAPRIAGAETSAETGPGPILSCVAFAPQDRVCRGEERTFCDVTASNAHFRVGVLRPQNMADGALPMGCGVCVTTYGADQRVTHVCVGHSPIR